MYDLFQKLFERILGQGADKLNYDNVNPYSDVFEDDFNKVKRFFLFYLPPIILLIALLINTHPFALTFAENKNLILYKINRLQWEITHFDEPYQSRFRGATIVELDKKRRNDLEIIRIALKLYHAKNKSYPNGASELVLKGEITRKLEEFIGSVPLDYYSEQDKTITFLSNFLVRGYNYNSDGTKYTLTAVLSNQELYIITNDQDLAQ